MRVTVKDDYQIKEMDLSDALEQTNSYCDGQVEQAKDIAETNAWILARLIAHLVAKKVVSLEDAVSICGIFDIITPLEAP